MRKFSALILCLCITACGSEDSGEKPIDPLSTDAVPLDGFEPKEFSLVKPSDTCSGIESFFESYARLYMPDTKVSIACAEVSGEVYTEEELSEMIVKDQVRCADDRRCFKSLISVTRGNETDRYDALVVRFQDQTGSGVIGSLRRGNKHFLPRKGNTVFPGELLHDALSHLHETFKSWAQS